MLNHGKSCERCKGGRYYYCTATRCHRNSLAASLIYTFESYFNLLLKKYDWIRYFLCPSNFLKEKLIEMGMAEDRLVVIRNFLRCSEFEPNYDSDGYILYAGKLTPEKGRVDSH